jgi:hypothetical protein
MGTDFCFLIFITMNNDSRYAEYENAYQAILGRVAYTGSESGRRR